MHFPALYHLECLKDSHKGHAFCNKPVMVIVEEERKQQDKVTTISIDYLGKMNLFTCLKSSEPRFNGFNFRFYLKLRKVL